MSDIHLTLTRALGAYGSAYDPPGPQRAYTYEHQPGNGVAWNLGCSVSALRQHRSGDEIDLGLYLLKEMQARGLGVFEVEPKAIEASHAKHWLADVVAVRDGGNAITLYFAEIKSAKAFRDTFPASIVRPAPETHVACPCTLIAQDKDCPLGYPSMICGVCKGTGNTTPDQVTALACEMIKIASDIGEPEDPFAAWESVSLIQSQHGQLRKALKDCLDLLEQQFPNPAPNGQIARGRAALATTEGSTP